MSWTSQSSTSNHKPKGYPVDVSDVASTLLFEYILFLEGGLEKGRSLCGASDPERCRGEVYGARGEASVAGLVKVDRLQAHQPPPIARIWERVSFLVGRVCTYPRSLPIPSFRILLRLPYCLTASWCLHLLRWVHRRGCASR